MYKGHWDKLIQSTALIGRKIKKDKDKKLKTSCFRSFWIKLIFLNYCPLKMALILHYSINRHRTLGNFCSHGLPVQALAERPKNEKFQRKHWLIVDNPNSWGPVLSFFRFFTNTWCSIGSQWKMAIQLMYSAIDPLDSGHTM